MSYLSIYSRLNYRLMVWRTRPKRYANLFKVIYQNKCRRIMEIGTFDGIHAAQMITVAKIFHPAEQIEYFGFDLFELLTEEELKHEFSKRPPAFREVKERLEKTGANIHLYKGNTKITLPRVKSSLGLMDFIFIDGGHSIETITSDWNHAKDVMAQSTVVIFDDYLTSPEPEVNGTGCQTLIDGLDRDVYKVEIPHPMDSFIHDWGTLKTSMVKVVKKRDFS